MSYNFENYGFLNLDNLDYAPFILIDAGIEKRHMEHYMFDNRNRRGYSGYLFQYTLSGHGLYEYNGREYILEKDCAFFTSIPENSSYRLPETNADNCWEFFYLHFSGDAVAPFYRSFQKISGPVAAIPVDSGPVQAFLNLHAAFRNGYSLKKYEGGEFVHRFLASLFRELENPGNRSLSSHVARAAVIMEKEYAALDGLESLAARLEISIEHLSRIFRQEKGISPIRYLTNLRIQHSLSLLLNTTLSIDIIARTCGFSCGNYFSKVFRRHIGMSPEEYRRFR